MTKEEYLSNMSRCLKVWMAREMEKYSDEEKTLFYGQNMKMHETIYDEVNSAIMVEKESGVENV